MKKIGLIAGISFLAGALFFALTFGYFQKSDDQKPVLSPNTAQAETINVTGLNFAPLVKQVRPAVVKVLSESIRERRSIFGDNLLDKFFNIPGRGGGTERVSGMGSGFIISKDGYIITNNHVVKNAVKVKIVTLDKNEYTAKIIGTDPKTDLALLKVNAKDLPFIQLGDSNKIEVGEWVLAIGNPFSQDLTVTAGIISAKGRQLGAAEYEDFLQTDAAINQGNSGGPLINMMGKVVGINSIIIAPAGGNVGIGFSIPSNIAKKVIRDLKNEGRVIRGYLGVSISEIPGTEAKEYGLAHGGVVIFKVEDNSPADKAGLKRYDLIVKMNGEKVKSMASLRNKIANLNPGTQIELTVNRDKLIRKIKIKVAEAPDTIKYKSRGEESRSFDLGMVLLNNNSGLAGEYGLKISEGIFVKSVERRSSADKNGIKKGDVLLEVNRTAIDSVKQFRDIISRKNPGSLILLYINRDGEEGVLRFRLPE
jgi:serine protease Do